MLAVTTIVLVIAFAAAVDAPLWAVVVTCVAAALWVIAGLVRDRVPFGVELALLAAVLVAAGTAVRPTYGLSLYPVAGILVMAIGETRMPSTAAWAWPVVGVIAAALGFAVTPSGSPSLVVWLIAAAALTIVIASIAGFVRRATAERIARQFSGLEQAYIEELARIQASAGRVLAPERLRCRFPELTNREAEVLASICRGRSNDEIAAELFISVATVKWHVNSLFAKLPARDRAQAMALALGTASVEVPSPTRPGRPPRT